MAKKTKLSNTIDMLLGKGEDTVDVTDELRERDAIGEELAKLEEVVAKDRATETEEERLTREVAEFKLSARGKRLLSAACENVGANMGSNMMDEPTQKQIQERAALFAACDNNLSEVIDTLAGAIVDPKVASSTIYSTCFAVQKAANFIANLWYRRALDPVEDEDLAGNDGTVEREDGARFHADQRQELREPIIGLGPDKQPDEYDPIGDILDAYVEVHDYLQLLTEAFGWDPDRSMPYCYVLETTGNFTPITDPTAALDIMEVKSKESRKRRQVQQTQALAQAIAARRKALKAAAAH